MKYKLGQGIFIKAEISNIDNISKEYFVTLNPNSINWVSEDKIIPMDKTYSDGLNDAWELAKKILDMKIDVAVEVFDCTRLFDVMDKFNPQEALAKIEAYEKEKEIKVGSIVKSCAGGFGIVTRIEHDKYYVVWRDGSCNSYELGRLTNTGKMEESLKSLLRKIGE